MAQTVTAGKNGFGLNMGQPLPQGLGAVLPTTPPDAWCRGCETSRTPQWAYPSDDGIVASHLRIRVGRFPLLFPGVRRHRPGCGSPVGGLAAMRRGRGVWMGCDRVTTTPDRPGPRPRPGGRPPNTVGGRRPPPNGAYAHVGKGFTGASHDRLTKNPDNPLVLDNSSTVPGRAPTEGPAPARRAEERGRVAGVRRRPPPAWHSGRSAVPSSSRTPLAACGG